MNDLTVIISATDYNAETTKTLYDHFEFTDIHDSLTRYVVNPLGAGSTTEWLHKHCKEQIHERGPSQNPNLHSNKVIASYDIGQLRGDLLQ